MTGGGFKTDDQIVEEWLMSRSRVPQAHSIKRETNDRVSQDYFKFKENIDYILMFIINPSQ